jgi:hypothetical protein
LRKRIVVDVTVAALETTPSNCLKCHAALRASAKFCGNCGAQVLQESNICPSCGNSNKRAAKFCGHCANRLEKAEDAPDGPTLEQPGGPSEETPNPVPADSRNARDLEESLAPGAAVRSSLASSMPAGWQVTLQRLTASLQDACANVLFWARANRYVAIGAAAAILIVAITGILLLVRAADSVVPAAVGTNNSAETTSGTLYATRLAHVRNAPTSIGTAILGDVQRGDALNGSWVVGRDGVTKWLKIARTDGSFGFVWGNNLSAVTPVQPDALSPGAAPTTATGNGPEQPASTPPVGFEAYSVSMYTGAFASPDFRNSPAEFWKFRTVIREGAARGINFAGHYALITIGCGTDCSTTMLVDVTSGIIFDFPLGGENYYNLALDYRPYSRLLIAHWQENEPANPVCVEEELVLVGTSFNPLQKQQQPGTCPS